MVTLALNTNKDVYKEEGLSIKQWLSVSFSNLEVHLKKCLYKRKL